MARKTKQQAEETRQLILDAALRVFAKRGVSASSLKDIALEAGVTRGAIYWHFKNKVDLFSAIWEISESQIDQMEKTAQAQFPDNPLMVFRTVLIHLLVATVSDERRRALLEIIFHKCEFVGELTSLLDAKRVVFAQGYDRIEAGLKECILCKFLPSNLDVRRSAIILNAYITGLIENWLFAPTRFDLKAEAEVLVDIYFSLLQSSPMLLCPSALSGAK